MESFKKSELIEKFFSKTLSQNEQQVFEQLLSTDPEFKKDFVLEQELRESLKGEDFHTFRNTLKNVGEKFETKQPDAKVWKLKTRMIRAVVGIAASFLIVFFVYNNFQKSPISLNEDLFAQNFEPYQMILTQRTIDTSRVSQTLKTAIESYETDNYREAAESFESLILSQPENASYYFYAGLNYLLIEEYEKASEKLLYLIERDDHLFVQQARWYLSLNYLKSGKTSVAIALLKQIDVIDYKYDEAVSLQRKLEKIK